MKGLAPIVVLAAIIGAVFLMTMTDKTCTRTMTRVVACAGDTVIAAAESALAETDFHVVESKTRRDGGIEGRLAAENQAGSMLSLALEELPQGRLLVQITVSGGSRNEASMILLENRVENALEPFQVSLAH